MRKRTRLRKMVSGWERGRFEATVPYLALIGSQTQRVANTLQKMKSLGMAFLFIFSIRPVFYVIFPVLLSLFSFQFFHFCIVVYTFFSIISLFHQPPHPCLHLFIPLSGFYKMLVSFDNSCLNMHDRGYLECSEK